MSFQVGQSHYAHAFICHPSGFAMRWNYSGGRTYSFIQSECCGEDVSTLLPDEEWRILPEEELQARFKKCDYCEQDTVIPASIPRTSSTFNSYDPTVETWLEIYLDTLECILAKQELKEILQRLAEEATESVS